MANPTTLYQNGDGRTQVDVTENKTLTLADCGIIQNVTIDAITVTLPSTAAGSVFTVRNGGVAASSSVGSGTGADNSVLVSVAPAAADKIQGLAFTAADNKAALNTKLTSRVGDFLDLVGDGVDGYNIQRARGVWARAA